MPFITCVVFITLALPILLVLRLWETRDRQITNHYLAQRVENVDRSNLVAQVKRAEKIYGNDLDWIVPTLFLALQDHPEGTLFFYNSSEEQWRNLGGEMGYAIMLHHRIVWKRRLRIS